MGSRDYMQDQAVRTPVSPNKKLVEAYLGHTDRSKAAALLADDVEWIEWGDGVPASGVRTSGKAAFVANFGDDELRTQVHRMTEENNIVVAEGTVRVTKKDGQELTVRFCNIFELENGKVKRLNSFGALLKDSP
jgi:ketosteroid isomerase-like protein